MDQILFEHDDFHMIHQAIIRCSGIANRYFCYLCFQRRRKISSQNSAENTSSRNLSRFSLRCMECRRGLAMRILSVRLSVRPSVCLSVTRVDCEKNGRKICPDIYTPHERTCRIVFWEEEWLVGGATPFTGNFGSTDPRWSEIANFQPIFVRSSWAVTPSEKSSIEANGRSTMLFPMSLRWSSYVAPKSPKGGLENAKRPISV